MRKLYNFFYLLLASMLIDFSASAQNFTNKGREFWVGYGHHQYMEYAGDNSQEMAIYLATGDSAATVTIQIDSSGSLVPGTVWTRTYSIPANTAISITDPMPTGVTVTRSPATIPLVSPIPKGLAGRDANYDARLWSIAPPAGTGGEGLFRKKGIHITSTAEIVAYAHIYGGVSSGATMLIPTESWGYKYTAINSEQNNADNAYSWMYVLAKHNDTHIKIVPSTKTRNGRLAGSVIDTILHKGQIYQVISALTSTTGGPDLTGTTVESYAPTGGQQYPIAVFCGSSRTGGETPCNAGGRDNDIQQLFPQESWGKQYLTAPFSNSTSLSSLMQCVYKVAVNDPTTIVKRNGVVLTGLINNNYYKFTSTTADLIEADKPVLVAQFMGGGCAAADGDPEMVYLSPLDQAITKTRFYRNSKEAINANYLTLCVPTAGLASLKIDGVFFASIAAASKHSYAHPNMPGYTVVVRKWPVAKAESFVECLLPFTGITYGLGGAESYGYNVGCYFHNANLPRYNTIYGYAFLDANSNGVKDAGEPFFSGGRTVVLKSGIDTVGLISGSGDFSIATDTGSFVTRFVPYHPLRYNVVPASRLTNFYSAYNQSDPVIFAVQPLTNVNDVAVYLNPTRVARLGMNVRYDLVYSNEGTVAANGVVELVKSPKTDSLLYVSVQPSAVNGDTLRWNYTALAPTEIRSITVEYRLPGIPVNQIGDTILATATIIMQAADADTTNNTSMVLQRGVAAYDPNDKTERRGGTIKQSAALAGEFLQYTIRFQNTGNDTAFKVVIADTLDNKLDWSSLRMVTASHDYQLNVTQGRNCSWTFNNINLPDSNTNEPQSHGYLTFLIKTKNTVQPGDTIRNNAFIYFDANPAIKTNTEKTAIVTETLPLKLLSFTAWKQDKVNVLQWATASEVNVDRFEVQRSNGTSTFEILGLVRAGQTEYRFTDSKPINGNNYYRLRMVDKDGQFSYSPVRTVNNQGGLNVSVYPNPAKDVVQVQVISDKSKTLQLRLTTAEGKTVMLQTIEAPQGSTQRSLQLNGLQKGHYILQVTTADSTPIAMKFEKL